MIRAHVFWILTTLLVVLLVAGLSLRRAQAEPCRVTSAGDHVQLEDFSDWEERYGHRAIVGACVADPHNQGLDHEAIECMVTTTTGGTRAHCFARRESGAEFLCSTRAPDMIDMFRAVGPGADLAFAINSGGECVGGVVAIGTDSEPMRPPRPRE